MCKTMLINMLFVYFSIFCLPFFGCLCEKVGKSFNKSTKFPQFYTPKKQRLSTAVKFPFFPDISLLFCLLKIGLSTFTHTLLLILLFYLYKLFLICTQMDSRKKIGGKCKKGVSVILTNLRGVLYYRGVNSTFFFTGALCNN